MFSWCERGIRFYNEDLHPNEIFPILSSARAWNNVILAGKYGSRRQSSTSFSENVRVAKTSDQMLEILIIWRSVEDFTSFNGNKRANFCGEKKCNEAFCGRSPHHYHMHVKLANLTSYRGRNQGRRYSTA